MSRSALPEQIVAEWQALAAEAAEPNSFSEPWFIAASLAHLGRGRDIGMMEVRRGARLVGLLPVVTAHGYARLPVAFVQSWRHHHLFLATPLIRAGEEETFWTAIIEALDKAPWAPNFLHLDCLSEDGPVHRGLVAAARKLGRSCPAVHREVRALLESEETPQAYYERAVRKKKRKELARLRNRLDELGEGRFRRLERSEEITPWCDAYLALERGGWKGREGSALGCSPETEAFFRDAVAGAFAAGRLQMLRMDLDERPIAMLVNFLAPPGSFSFKTAFDEDYARFSPGVLIQIENLKILARGDISWMDSCASEDHPMIDSLWLERRSVVRVTVRLRGLRRSAVYALCRALEIASASSRNLVRKLGRSDR